MRRRDTAVAVAVIVAAALAAYSNSFRTPFFFDDLRSIVGNPTIRSLVPALSPPAGGITVEGRPILNLSLAVNYAISGIRPWSYHAVNVLIHILAGLALFGIARRTFERCGERMACGGDKAFLAALALALVWTLHPLQTEAVTYVIQRAESLMGLFFLVSTYCFLRYAAEGGGAWAAASAAACVLAAGTKEVAVAIPILVLLYDRTFVAGSFRNAVAARWRGYAALFAGWLFLAFLAWQGGGNRGGSKGFGVGVSWMAWERTQAVAIVQYLKLSVWPHPLIFWREPFWIGAAAALPYIGAVASLAAIGLWALRRAPVLGFLGAWFFCILSVTSALPGANDMIAERRMYLPLAAVLALGTWALVSNLGRLGFAICLAWAAALGGATWLRNADYASLLSIWSDTARKQPDNARAHNDIAVELAKIPGRAPEAVAHYERALAIHPDFAEAYNNLGNLWAQTPGRDREALRCYEEALRRQPDYAEAHNNLAAELARVPGRQSEAIAHYEEALRLDPTLATAHCNLAGLLEQIPGRRADAEAQYREALRVDPDYAEAHCNLGSLLAGIPGRIPEALVQYAEALRSRPDFAEAHYNLANVLAGMPGRLPEAAAHYAEALKLRPDFVEAQFNLAIALVRLGRPAEAVARFREVLRIDPENPQARAWVTRLGAGLP